ncbi:MAG: binding-protein-dependent transport system inner rane component [Paenibacillaceae bacterium]|jgi:putative aldouronate transport system permease protein|nr:binding-protein-dependent transport system inner rane component [Paenibacillaceae bacterium]
MVRDKTVSSKILDLTIQLTMLLVIIIVLVPIVHIISVSLSHPDEIALGRVGLWPVRLDFLAYSTILTDSVVPRAVLNSLIITITGTAVNIVLTTLTAYAISKKELPFHNTIITYILITMLFSGGLIPTFLVVRAFGMYDSFASLVIPVAVNAYYLIIMHSFFKGFPAELEESARLDGCNDLQIFARIVLPLSKAAVATISLFYVVGHWNSFFTAMIYLKDSHKFPLQLVLREIVLQTQLADRLAEMGQTDLAEQVGSKVSTTSVQYATLVVSIIPMMIVYPFVQKYFVQGVMIGSLKG